MKKIVLMLALTVLGAGAMSARAGVALVQQGGGQGGGQNMTPEERVNRQLTAMTEQLTLTADQSAKIKPILLARANEQVALRQKFQGDREGMMAEMRKLGEKYNPQLKAVLTAEQYAKYEANQAQMRGAGGGQRQGGGNNK